MVFLPCSVVRQRFFRAAVFTCSIDSKGSGREVTILFATPPYKKHPLKHGFMFDNQQYPYSMPPSPLAPVCWRMGKALEPHPAIGRPSPATPSDRRHIDAERNPPWETPRAFANIASAPTRSPSRRRPQQRDCGYPIEAQHATIFAGRMRLYSPRGAKLCAHKKTSPFLGRLFYLGRHRRHTTTSRAW